MDIKYSSGTNVILGTSYTPITNAVETLINVNTLSTNNPDNQVEFLKGNTQASLGFYYVHGSLTSASITISWYRNEPNHSANAYQKTAGSITAGVETISLHSLLLGTTDGRYNYDFQVPECDGVLIQITSVGTTTSSAISEVHLALRTN